MKYVILLAQAHIEFRVAELRALADLEGINVDLSGHDPQSSFLEVELASDEQARALVSKSILAKSIYRVFSEADTLEKVFEQNKRIEFPEIKDRTFKVEFQTFQGTREEPEKRQIIYDLYDTMEQYLNGKVRLKNPEVTLCFLERYSLDMSVSTLEYIWFTRLIAVSDRAAMDKYDLKKRRHVGTTSFDAELSLITANMAHVRPGKFVYDPFAGTGSFPLAAAHFGGVCFASDIDFRALTGYKDNFKQYGTSTQLALCVEMDFTHNALRKDIMFDSILCDPPYGVRERIVVCGAAKPEKFKGKENIVIDGELAHRRRDYCATKKPYPMSQLLRDLLDFAAERLVENGRLAYWLPVDYEQPLEAPPLHRHLEHIESCVQRFGKWERWLLVYRRRAAGEEEGPESAVQVNDNFRDNYMKPRRG